MRLKLVLAAACMAAAGVLSLADCGSAPATSEGAGGPAIQKLSAESQAFVQQISSGLVRIKFEQNPESLLTKAMKSDWDNYRDEAMRNGGGRGGPLMIRSFQGGRGGPGGGGQNNGPGGGGRWGEGRGPGGEGRGGPGGEGRGPGGGGDKRGATTTAPATPAGPVKMTPQVFAVLEQFLENADRQARQQKDVAKSAEAQHVLMRVRSLRAGIGGDMFASIYDGKGHAIMLSAVVLPADKTTVTAITEDGKELSAKVLGTNFVRGYTVLQIEAKIDSPGNAPPTNPLGGNRPNGGDLLMSMGPTSGALNWVTVPMQGWGRRHEERFNVNLSDEQGVAYLFSTKGELAALATNRSALPMAMLASEIKLMEAGTTIQPRSLGIQFDLVASDASDRRQNKLLGTQPALKVKNLIAGSAAEKVGIKEGDYIVQIDGKPANQVQRIMEEISTGTTNIKIVLIRGDEKLEMELPLE